ncbi:uncharacterized protein [Argopecten irradians]|uniref:uncharacterized protein n=1 Tax=Argopecten irradians TaxID=31199 RepID=UPI00371ECA60
MNSIYLLTLAVCVVGCWATENPLSKRSMLRMIQGPPGRNSGRHPGQDDRCLMAMMCPTTEIQIPMGNLGTTLHFELHHLESVCNYTAQFLECFDMLSASFTCGEMSNLVADVFRVLQDRICQQPWQQDVLSLLQCANNKALQVVVFGELQRLSGVASAYHEMGLPMSKQMSKLCRRQFSSFNGVMSYTTSLCDGNVYNTVCDIRARLDPYMDAMLSILSPNTECPKETFRCQRGL